MAHIPTNLPIEITNKYSVVSNSFKLDKIVNAELDKYKNEPKDEINVIVGDDKQPDFIPQVKLCRWTDEVNFSVRLIDNQTGNETVTTATDKIKWAKGNLEIEYFDIPGGYKMLPYFKKKPKTNKVEFTMQSKGLDFFRQPPLTEEYQNGYSEEFKKEIVVTETQVKDLNGNVLVERPENVVGSYAVYHQTKGGMNDGAGKDYKVGKAFHIYRPHLIDANGLEAWGNLHIENGIYSVEIPQDFLDNAVYPIKSNDTFGYTSVGATGGTTGTGTCHGQVTTSGGVGNVTSISVYFTDYSQTDTQCGIYSVSGSTATRVDPQSSSRTDDHSADGWYEHTVSNAPITNTTYLIGVVGSTREGITRHDNGVGTNTFGTLSTGGFPASSTITFANGSQSIYATYTAASTRHTASCTSVATLTQYSSPSTNFINGFRITCNWWTSRSSVLSLVDTFNYPLRRFTKALTGAISAVDSLATTFFARISQVATIALTDTSSALRRFTQSLSEIIVLNRVIAAVHNYSEAISETVVFQEILSLVARFNTALSSNISLAEILSKIGGFRKTITEVISLADIVSSARSLVYSAIEAIGIADTITKIAGFVKSVSDTIVLTEIVSKINSFAQTLTDTIGLSDIVSSLRNLFYSATDTLGLTDIASAITTFVKSIVDTISFAEIVVANILTTFHSVVVTEVISLSETINKWGNFVKSVSDAISLNDAISWANNFLKDISETIASSEIVSITSNWWKALNEEIDLTEIFTKIQGRTETITETITMVDTKILMWIMSLTETIQLSSVLERVTSKWRLAISEVIELIETWEIPGTWWDNLTKHTSTWANQVKNTAVWSGLTKNTSAWSNQSKNTSTWTKQTKNTSTWTNVQGVRRRRE